MFARRAQLAAAREHGLARAGIDAAIPILALLALLVGAAAARAQNLALEPLLEGLTAPLHLEEPADGSGRKFIVQQDGVVLVLGADARLGPEPFLDLRPRMLPLEQNFEERGLLGFALHPQFARNGRVFATYTAPLRPGAPERWNYTRRVSEFTADPGNLAKIDAGSERVLLEIDWPSRKHNGGALAFGTDGFLYIGLGDGGISHGIGKKVLWEAFEVPAEALTWDGLAQDIDTLFGKILRIDIDRGFPGYAIPRDNPFAARPGKKEIWAWGFRNPFRIAFDRNDGSFFVTAVAETLWEAAYRVQGPGNFGWPLMEGTHCVDRLKPRQPPPTCPPSDEMGNRIVQPILEYPNMQASHPETKLAVAGVGTAITGARMYRGRAIPALAGKLIVADWSATFKQPSGQIFIAEPSPQSGQLWPYRRALQVDTRIIGLAEDRAGEIFVLTNETLGPYGTTGKVLRLVERP
jgi:glucose/arabinose dehydrogenase